MVILRELTGATIYSHRLTGLLSELASLKTLEELLTQCVRTAWQSEERIWAQRYPFELFIEQLQFAGIFEKSWASPAKEPEKFARRPLLKRLAEAAWPTETVVFDMLDALLIRAEPRLERAFPQSASDA